MTTYGTTLPTTIATGCSGETSSISIVPVSFSRVIEMAVIIAETMVSTSAMSPGTKRFTLSSVGLNRMRAATSSRTPPARMVCSACQRCSTADAYACMMLPVLGSAASVTTWMDSGARPSSARSTSGGRTMACRSVPSRNC